MKVADMPHSVREALINRGCEPDDEMDARAAMREWSAWHLGDSYWAENIIDLYERMNAADLTPAPDIASGEIG